MNADIWNHTRLDDVGALANQRLRDFMEHIGHSRQQRDYITCQWKSGAQIRVIS